MMDKTTFSRCLDKTSDIERNFLASDLYNKLFRDKPVEQINLLAFITLCLPACCVLACVLIVASAVDFFVELFKEVRP